MAHHSQWCSVQQRLAACDQSKGTDSGCVLGCRSVKVGKATCSTADFIGAPFGAVFELSDDGHTLKRCARCTTLPLHFAFRNWGRAAVGVVRRCVCPAAAEPRWSPAAAIARLSLITAASHALRVQCVHNPACVRRCVVYGVDLVRGTALRSKAL